MAGHTGSESQGQVFSPFGQMPNTLARGYQQNFAQPLSRQLGYNHGQGPLADYISQSQNFLPGVFNQAQNIGTEIASKAPGLFNQYQNQISGFLSQLPNFQQQAGAQGGEAQGLFNRAQEGVNQAFSPVQSNALTSNALRNTLQQTRGAAGGRGLLDAGTTQASEENIAQQMYQGAAQNQFGQQQQALAGAGQALGQQQGALGTQAQLGMAGVAPAGAAMDALQPYAQALSSAFNIPMDALQSVFSQLSSAQNPMMGLLSQVLPQIAQKASSKGTNVL